MITFYKDLSIIIEDTTAPIITQLENDISFEINEEIELDDYFSIEDNSEFSYEFIFDDFIENTPNIYSVTLSAKDIYNNESQLTFDIRITESRQKLSTFFDNVDSDYSQSISNNKTDSIPSSESQDSFLMIVDGILIVNKRYPVPEGYTSYEDNEAVSKLRDFISDMQSYGYDIDNTYSGYRSIEYQSALYTNYVKNYGQLEADRFSARPRHSEHHTGLAFDLRHTNKNLVTKDEEVEFIKNNAHKYGFIVRYPKGKEHITGYMHEPWHLRYLGSRSLDVFQSGLTLEEFLNVEGNSYK